MTPKPHQKKNQSQPQVTIPEEQQPDEELRRRYQDFQKHRDDLENYSVEDDWDFSKLKAKYQK